MSLRPKTIDFPATFESFRQELLSIFLVEKQTPVKGIELYQSAFDMYPILTKVQFMARITRGTTINRDLGVPERNDVDIAGHDTLG
jgi:hypothetical protein